MMQFSDNSEKLPRKTLAPALFAVHTICCCISFVVVLQLYGYLHLFTWSSNRIYEAALLSLPIAALAIAMIFAKFSFGYLLSFYLYTVTLGYLWLTPFSQLGYDRKFPVISAIASTAAFLAPALFLKWPIKIKPVVSIRGLHRLIAAIIVATLAIIATGIFYNFKLVGLSDIYQFRDQLKFPTPLQYAMGITLGALLPFAFACCVEMRARLLAAATLLLCVALYPVTLTKTALFAPVWLCFLLLVSTYLEARIAVIVSLLGPIAVGLVLAVLSSGGLISESLFLNYFGTINFRMIAFPSVAIDVYNDFFSRHEITHFCQISVLKHLMTCPYDEQLLLVISKNYPVGNMNASLLATEGIASVGSAWAPASALLAGLVLSVGNQTSEGLPPRFVILSSGMVAQAFLNVPLTVLMVTNGTALLFLLWYIIPRLPFAGASEAGFKARV